MGEYLPHAGNHSIQEAAVAIHFYGPLAPGAVERARNSAEEALKRELPLSVTHRELPPIQLEPTAGGLSVAATERAVRVAGFELRKSKGDGNPARVLRLLNDTLTVNFLEYKDWPTTSSDALNYIEPVLSSIDLSENPIVAVSLRYLDRYTFDGDPSEPHAELLLRKGNSHIAARCFDAGPLWHSNSGWFEPVEGGDRILDQLNAGSTEHGGVSTIAIDHNAICRFQTPCRTLESLFGRASAVRMNIEDKLALMHTKNTAVLKDILQPEMAGRIGLAI